MKADERDGLYQDLSDDSVNIRDGVEGHVDFGPDHPMYEAMGFTTLSQRKSGLTRKKKRRWRQKVNEGYSGLQRRSSTGSRMPAHSVFG